MVSIACRGALLIIIGVALTAGPSHARADDFYAKRQIKLLIGNNAGTSYDLSARLVGRHLGRHIPGEPTLVPQNMPGASGIIATNYAYNVAPRDGSVIVGTVQTVPQRQVLGDENVKFDAAKLSWIGNPASSVNVMVTWHTAPVKTFEAARHQKALMAAMTRDASSGIEVALANNLLGAQFQLVPGYKGNEIDLAMERGEAQGRAGQSWDGWKITHSDWVEQKTLNVLVQVGLNPSRELADVPQMLRLAKNDEQRQILELYSAPITLGRPLFVGPDVPAGRIAILRTAFRQTMSDPAFLGDARKLNYDVDPVWGEDLQAIVARMLATPAAIVAKAKDAMTYRN
jgi:tripartite-type tricarboxylate transporter receptor subunit TctC